MPAEMEHEFYNWNRQSPDAVTELISYANRSSLRVRKMAWF
jgi:hypothetical protein